MQLVTKDNMQVAFWAHIAGFATGALIGTIYLLLHQSSISKQEKYNLDLIFKAWEALADGNKAEAQVLRDEFLEINNSGLLSDKQNIILNILNDGLDGNSEEKVNNISEMMMRARKRNDYFSIVQLYFMLAVSRHPRKIPSWLHREGGVGAMKTGNYKLALYAFSCELVSGINERVDQFIYTLFNLLAKMDKDEEAKKLGNMLREYYPSSQYAEMLEETSP